jgi:hypothetical protein
MHCVTADELNVQTLDAEASAARAARFAQGEDGSLYLYFTARHTLRRFRALQASGATARIPDDRAALFLGRLQEAHDLIEEALAMMAARHRSMLTRVFVAPLMNDLGAVLAQTIAELTVRHPRVLQELEDDEDRAVAAAARAEYRRNGPAAFRSYGEYRAARQH